MFCHFFPLGGFHSNRLYNEAEIYNSTANTFTALPSKMSLKAFAQCAAKRNTDGNVYITGGKLVNAFERRIIIEILGYSKCLFIAVSPKHDHLRISHNEFKDFSMTNLLLFDYHLWPYLKIFCLK